MDLRTRYLGLDLRSPLIVGANPLTERIDELRKMEDAGAGAVVLLSLFEEQLTLSQAQLEDLLGGDPEVHARAAAATPERSRLKMGPLGYLELVRKAKDAVDMPVFASLNGSPRRQWTHYAKLVEQAGADGIELNLYYVPTAPTSSGADVERAYFEAAASVRQSVQIPVAVKLNPFFTNMAFAARSFEEAGADGLVLFNRFYQPDVDLETRQVRPQLSLSRSEDARLPLRWIGILRPQVQLALAATSGIHTAEDALKMIAVGADAVQLCSVLLKHGSAHLKVLANEIGAWLEAHETTLDALRGSVRQGGEACASAFERAQYMRNLDSFRAP